MHLFVPFKTHSSDVHRMFRQLLLVPVLCYELRQNLTKNMPNSFLCYRLNLLTVKIEACLLPCEANGILFVCRCLLPKHIRGLNPSPTLSLQQLHDLPRPLLHVCAKFQLQVHRHHALLFWTRLLSDCALRPSSLRKAERPHVWVPVPEQLTFPCTLRQPHS